MGVLSGIRGRLALTEILIPLCVLSPRVEGRKRLSGKVRLNASNPTFPTGKSVIDARCVELAGVLPACTMEICSVFLSALGLDAAAAKRQDRRRQARLWAAGVIN